MPVLPTREELLAKSFKHKISAKYVPDDTIKWKVIKHPVVPLKNRRLDMLAELPKFKKTPKYTEPEERSTYIPRAVLETTCTPRLDHMSHPPVVKLKALGREKAYLGKEFQNFVKNKINETLETIYYHNVKSKMVIEQKKKDMLERRRRQRASGPIKLRKTWDVDGDKERMEILARPRPTYQPTPPPKRVRKPLEYFQERLKKLAKPNKEYKSPSQDSMIVKEGVKPSALKYKISERTKGLTRLPQRYLVKQPPFAGYVKPGALRAKMTERLEKLAAPRPRANAPMMDAKENPYDICKNALKYKATARIKQLAKPIQR